MIKYLVNKLDNSLVYKKDPKTTGGLVKYFRGTEVLKEDGTLLCVFSRDVYSHNPILVDDFIWNDPRDKPTPGDVLHPDLVKFIYMTSYDK